ncbi:MAG: divalent-cation tolerance protein CutA [Wenzhouxiangella sp.]|nr:divalent-cation tolerance protein CutA [Wenzhouxiangella sp.]TVR95273.1 MAG: divalent-cation tolerance protein CutA [Wenzhouxiangellaceae bacterium]
MTMEQARLWLVMTTVESQAQGEQLARRLVEQRLAACVSLGQPVSSVYPWQGTIESASEVPLWIKTTPDRLPALKSALDEHHPYEVPEMLAVPVKDGLEAYFRWAQEWINDEQ